ncbi:c-type cytochrome [Phenylobacterium sp.]|uniref:c-type cytochrome n=1 Tax=Phenylobacterium sp. TaxID=1871053 RepID=UPI002FDF36CB
MRHWSAPGPILALALTTGGLGGCGDTNVSPAPVAGGDPGRGRTVIADLGCGACHVIPGVAWPRGRVGPSLEGFGDRSLIAGRFPNRPDILIRWVRDAPSLSPQTGMPAMPLTEPEARDVAAYLYTLDAR